MTTTNPTPEFPTWTEARETECRRINNGWHDFRSIGINEIRKCLTCGITVSG